MRQQYEKKAIKIKSAMLFNFTTTHKPKHCYGNQLQWSKLTCDPPIKGTKPGAFLKNVLICIHIYLLKYYYIRKVTMQGRMAAKNLKYVFEGQISSNTGVL